ncbi:MAG: XrtA/PEP-CTERM system TPR-repeat protein PrsT [Pseudomonadota bacterium]
MSLLFLRAQSPLGCFSGMRDTDLHRLDQVFRLNSRRLHIISSISLMAMLACTPKVDPVELLARAQTALASGDIIAAEIDTRAMLADSPEDSSGRLLLGRIYLLKGDPEAAQREFERSSRTSTSEEAAVWLVRAMVDSGDEEEFIEGWRGGNYVAIEADSDFQATVARALLILGEEAAGREALARAIAFAPTPSDYLSIMEATVAATIDEEPERAKSVLQALTKRSPRNAEAWNLLGELAVVEKDFSNAETYLRQAVEKNPVRFSYQVRLAELLVRQDKKVEAETKLVRLRRVAPRSRVVNLLSGQLSYGNGNYSDAVDFLNQVLAIEPRDVIALRLIAASYFQLDQLVAARRSFEQLTGLLPDDSDLKLELAKLLLQLGELGAAEKEVKAALALSPENRLAQELYANVMARQGRHRESAQAYASLAIANPQSTGLKVALGAQEFLSGDTGLGIERIQTAVSSEPNNALAQRTLIEALIASGDVSGAVGAAEQYIQLEPESVNAKLLLGRALTQKRDLSRAGALFEQVLEGDSGNREAAGGLAAVAVLRDDTDAAQDAYRESLLHYPGDLFASMNLAFLQSQAGQFREMQDTLEKSIEANPEAVRPRLALAHYFLSNREAEKAINTLLTVESAAAQYPRIAMVLAGAYLITGNQSAAASQVNRLIKLQPEDPNALILAARVAAVDRQFDSALEYIESAKGFAPEDIELRKLHAEVLAMAGYLEESIEEFEALPSEHQLLANSRLFRGRLALANKNFNKAIEELEAFQVLNPSSMGAGLLATASWSLGEREQAIETLEAWLTKEPDDVATLEQLASRQLQLEANIDAIKSYKRLAEIQDNNIIALNNLAWLLRKTSPEEALGYIEMADSLYPQSSQIKDTYAMVEFELGKYERALALNEKALIGAGNSADSVRLNRVQILEATGQKQEAETLLRGLSESSNETISARAKAILTESY